MEMIQSLQVLCLVNSLLYDLSLFFLGGYFFGCLNILLVLVELPRLENILHKTTVLAFFVHKLLAICVKCLPQKLYITRRSCVKCIYSVRYVADQVLCLLVFTKFHQTVDFAGRSFGVFSVELEHFIKHVDGAGV